VYRLHYLKFFTLLFRAYGSTHAPKQLQAWLNQKRKQEGWNFTVEAVWLPKYASWLDQIEIWFSILQRKLLTQS